MKRSKYRTLGKQPTGSLWTVGDGPKNLLVRMVSPTQGQVLINTSTSNSKIPVGNVLSTNDWFGDWINVTFNIYYEATKESNMEG